MKLILSLICIGSLYAVFYLEHLLPTEWYAPPTMILFLVVGLISGTRLVYLEIDKLVSVSVQKSIQIIKEKLKCKN